MIGVVVVWRLSHIAVASNMDLSYSLGTVHVFTRIIAMLTVLPPLPTADASK